MGGNTAGARNEANERSATAGEGGRTLSVPNSSLSEVSVVESSVFAKTLTASRSASSSVQSSLYSCFRMDCAAEEFWPMHVAFHPA